MPSVEMRRTTRVFGARVLRSGRRLFTTQEQLKHMRRAPHAVVDNGEDWIDLLDHGRGGGGGGGDEFKENGWRNSNEERKEVGMDIDEREPKGKVKLGKSKVIDSVHHVNHESDCNPENKRWGLVYSRKRKRISSPEDCNSPDKKYGKKFVRKQARKTIGNEESPPVHEIPPPNTTTEQNNSRIQTRLSSKSKSRRKNTRGSSVSKPTSVKLPNHPSRNSVTIHRNIQRRRSSLKSRKQRTPTTFRDGVPFFPIKSNPETPRSTPRPNFKELKSTVVELTQDIDSVTCTANILIIESDRCYRESDATITMEMSASNQWFLSIKKDKIERFRLEAKNIMRPCFCNRVTNAIIWTGGDESWKLEFPIRQDWFIFKELYRKCSERSIKVKKTSLASIIPVPRVNEVKGYADVAYVPFKMPDDYITLSGDELSRAMERRDPVYDMDSDDDEWLNKFNEDRGDLRVDDDTFERIIDAFERGIYGNLEVYSDATSAVDRCGQLAEKDVLESVYGYWMDKRKKKHSALVRVFQFYKPKRTDQLNIKAVLRKKRSFRQRGSQAGRGKQLTFLKAVLYDKNVAEESETTTYKVEETEAAAARAELAATKKREKAQTLMEIADLLTYKATMALKIAEARAVSELAACDFT